MNCPYCGAPVIPGAKFCTKCGARIDAILAQDDLPDTENPSQPSLETAPQQAAPQGTVSQEAAAQGTIPQESVPQDQPQGTGSPQDGTQPIDNYFYDPNAPQPGQPPYNSDFASGQPPYQGPGGPGYPGGPYPGNFQQPAPKKKKLTWLWITLGVLAAAAVAAVLLIFVLGGSKSVDLNKYITVTYNGVDTVGTADAEFDYNAFIKDNRSRIKFTKQAKREAQMLGYKDTDAADLLYQAYIAGYYYIDPSDHLSNGDTVTLSWSFSDEDIQDIKDKVNVDLKYESKDFTVDGLPKAETFDPFDGLVVTWTGVDTAGSVELDTSKVPSEAYYFQYTVDKDSGLSNGDTVTVTLTDWDGSDPTQQILEEYGKIPSPLTKEYTVEGLGEAKTFNPFDYVTLEFEGDNGQGDAYGEIDEDGLKALGIDYYDYDYNLEYPGDSYGSLKNGDTVTLTFTALDSDDTAGWFAANRGLIPDPVSKDYTVTGLTEYVSAAADIQEADLNKLTDQATSVINADNASSLSDSEKVNSLTYAGNYFLTAKDGMDPWPHNVLYLIYKINVTNGKGTYDYYTFVEYDDLKLDDRKALQVDISDYNTCYHSIYLPEDDYSYYYYGYKSLDDMYKDVCASEVDQYTVEDNTQK